MSKQIKLGIVGLGVIGQKHLEAASGMPHIAVEAVADLNAAIVERTAERYAVPRRYTDAEALIRDPGIEAVLLAVPTRGRTELALAAMAAGKHVLLEKPIGMNAGEVKRLLAAQGNVTAGCCSSRFRFYESADCIARFVATGQLGDLRVIRSRGVRAVGKAPSSPPPVWRLNRALNGGGVMVNWGCYDLDYVFGLTGWTLKPLSALAAVWLPAPHLSAHAAPDSDAESHVAASIVCANNVLIQLERGEFVAGPTEEVTELIGTRGTLTFTMMPAEKKIVFTGSDPERGAYSEVIWTGSEQTGNLHAGPVSDFARALLDGREPATSLKQACLIQAVTDAIYDSASTGRCADIAE
ncbi:Gfo/Idh/MocA family protein [Paenibacillus cymbidii]|uniref:Gfo/Idh/MocA family protein n=1 Tax=Paenibacillus cymbidii TaxID=1639034 RepID=UPI001081D008|nr:Gfo/Idh/MocA family oxidoreductase [Paenibacillus cymbidii]